MTAGTRDHRNVPARPTVISMTGRGSQLLEAHIRSLDPDEPNARERLAEALGEPFTRKLLFALCPGPPRGHVLAA